jgi:type III pantothenate kinase
VSWLLLDAGNSALKWALVPGTLVQWPGADTPAATASIAATHYRGVVAADASGHGTELAQACALSAALDGTTAPSLVAGCAVTTPERVRDINAALQAAGARCVQWLGAAAAFNHDGIALRSAYRDPGQLGADRWHALIGGRARYPRTTLAIINAGTATTVDGVQADGTFCGGVIVPGLALMRASLAGGTARLPLAAGNYVAHPDNTDDAIQTGILDAQIGLIERRVRRIRETTGAQPHVIVAGGNGAALAALLAAASFGPVAQEPDLVLRGLWHHARYLATSAIAPAA